MRWMPRVSPGPGLLHGLWGILSVGLVAVGIFSLGEATADVAAPASPLVRAAREGWDRWQPLREGVLIRPEAVAPLDDARRALMRRAAAPSEVPRVFVDEAPGSEEGGAPSPSGPALRGIIAAAEGGGSPVYRALFDRGALAVGERLGPWRVAAIDAGGAVLEGGGETLRLEAPPVSWSVGRAPR